jgi:hypothetical protein
MSTVFAFVAGAALTSALLVPNIATPDYQRGHRAGYDAGFQDGISLRGIDLTRFTATPKPTRTPFGFAAPHGVKL